MSEPEQASDETPPPAGARPLDPDAERERYIRFFNASSDLLMIADADGRLKLINRSYAQNFGYAVDELQGRCYLDLVHPGDRQATQAEFDVSLPHGPDEFVNRMTCRDGSLRWVAWHSVYLPEENAIYAAGHDVTARRQAEERLRSASSYARELLEASLDPLVTIDAQGKITDVNRATEEVTGIPRLELIGHDFSDCFTEPDKARAGYQRVFASGQVSDYPLTIRHVSGRLTEVLYNASVYRDELGQIAGVFAAARDLARHREHLEELVEQRTRELESAKQAAEAANRAKSAFLSNVSHELRTPMNAIVGMAYMLQQGRLDPAQQEQLDALQAASRQLLALIDDILNYTRIETGTLQTERRDFELAAVLDTVVGRVRDRAAAKGLTLQVELDAELPQRLKGDAQQLGQVLHKLADNAVKFTESGSVRLGVRLIERGAGDALLQFEVSDTGIGIAADELATLFERFRQVDDGADRRYGGTGLGLAIARRLVELMGGEIGVESEKERGSRFWVRIRLGVAPEAEPRQIPDGGEPAGGDSPPDLQRWQALRQQLIALLGQDDAECVQLFEANEALARAALGGEFGHTPPALRGFDFGAALQSISRA